MKKAIMGNLRLRSPAAIFRSFTGKPASVSHGKLVELKTFADDGCSHVRLPDGREAICATPGESYRDIQTGKYVSGGIDRMITKEVRLREFDKFVKAHFADVLAQAEPYDAERFLAGTMTPELRTVGEGEDRTFFYAQVPGGGCVICYWGYRNILTGEPVRRSVEKRCQGVRNVYELQHAHRIKKAALPAPIPAANDVTATPVAAIQKKEKARIVLREVRTVRFNLSARTLRGPR